MYPSIYSLILFYFFLFLFFFLWLHLRHADIPGLRIEPNNAKSLIIRPPENFIHFFSYKKFCVPPIHYKEIGRYITEQDIASDPNACAA